MADSTVEVFNAISTAGGLASGDLFYVFRPGFTDLDFNATPDDIVTFVEANATAFAAASHTHTMSEITDAGALATKNTIVNADIAVGAAIALSKLAVDPLARANHTGTQLMSTISNAGALATLSSINLTHIDNITANRLIGSDGTGDVVERTPAQIRTLLNVADGADVTNAASVNAAGAVMETDYNAYTILAADVDNVPLPLTVPINTLVGRKATGGIVPLTATDIRTLIGVTAGAEPNEFSFKTIKVPGQGDVVADSKTDILTIAAGTDIQITTNPGTDTITITSTAAGIGDVLGPGTHADNRLTRWDGVNTNTIQQSGITVDDVSNMSGVNNLTITGFLNGRDLATDSAKLDGIQSGAQVNQNAFAKVYVPGENDVLALGPSDTFTLIGGANVDIQTGGYLDHEITISVPGGGPGGLGDTFSPATHGTNIVPVFNGVDTKTLKVSPVSILANGDMSGIKDITLTGTVDGRDVSVDGGKLDTIQTGAEVNQNAFNRIVVPGQGDVVADSKTDTLNLAAGTNITITTVPGTDTITIGATLIGSGDVVGPASATDNALARYDTTTGKLIQNSGVLLSDTNDLSGIKDIILTGNVDGRDVSADGAKLDTIETGAQKTNASNVDSAGAVMESDFNAFTILAADTNDTPFALTVLPSTLVGRNSTGGIVAMNKTTLQTLLNIEDGAQVNTNSFSTIRVATEDDILALDDDDILTIVAGTNVQLDTNVASRQLTISANLTSGGNVIGPATHSDSTVPIWNGTDTKTLKTTGVLITATNDVSGIKDLGMTGNLTISGTVDGRDVSVDGAKLDTIESNAKDDQNLFERIVVSGQNDIVADSATDTLTLIAGSNISITTNDTTDSITINSSNPGGDVVGPGSATDNAIATFDGTTGKLIQEANAFIDGAGNITANNLSGTNTGDQTITLTGPVTGSGTGSFATTITDNAVTNAKLADMANATIKGRSTAGTGDPEDLTKTQVLAILNVEDGADVTDATNVNAAGAVMETDYNAFTILAADSDDVPLPLTVPASTFVGRKSTGGIVAMTTSEVRTELGVTAGAEPNEFSFKTIAVSGQSDVVADTTTDTLTLVAGTNVSITTNAGADSITINADTQGDVTGPGSSTGNAIARFNGITGKLLKDSSVTVTDAGVLTATNISGTNTGDQTITLTGEVTGSGTGSFAATITNGAVTLAKMANVASGTVFYRKTAGTGTPEVQTLATLKTDLGLTGTNTGDQTITLTGDVTGSGTGSFAATIAANAVTLSKFQQISTSRLLGRSTAGTGNVEQISLGSGLSLTAGVLNTVGSFGTPFVSSAQTITSGGGLTLAHSLGSRPTLMVAELTCVTGEAGYSTGDILNINITNFANNGGASLWSDATNVNVRYGSNSTVFSVPHKISGSATALTNTNWTFRVTAWV